MVIDVRNQEEHQHKQPAMVNIGAKNQEEDRNTESAMVNIGARNRRRVAHAILMKANGKAICTVFKSQLA